jgi:metallo-beta-lactamase family protein
MAHIKFYGAAGTVTGSCHLLEFNGKKFLLDCGQFQGPWEIEEMNYKPLGFNAKDVDGLILGHGHLDHCGRIPILVKQGFRGHIYSTPPTRDIARLILMDSAYVLKEEFMWKQRKLTRAGIQVAGPLYSMEDVYYSLDFFDKTIGYGEKVDLSEDSRLFFHAADAGHILGSAQVYIDYSGTDGVKKRLLYTGDLGDGQRPIVNDPQAPEKDIPIHALVIESTYGDREHRGYEDSVKEFEEAVTETVRNKGTVLIPTFALERTQELLYHLGNMKKTGLLAKDIPVFLNSPLAIDITRIYGQYCNFCNKPVMEEIKRGSSPFVFPGLHLSETVEESMAIHSVPGPKIILAGSGMMTGGRIKHHLKHLLWKESTALIIVGFQAEGTLGRKIIDGAKTVHIFGEPVAVRARIYTINGFSAHAGRGHLAAFAKAAAPRNIFIVHGEPRSSNALAEQIGKYLPEARIFIPEIGQKFEI